MPFCETEKYQQLRNGLIARSEAKIFYQTHGLGKIKVLCIMGLAASHKGWAPQIKGLTGVLSLNVDELSAGEDHKVIPADENDGIEICVFDNRGVGRSSVPVNLSEYTTAIMAEDALALMDHLGWSKAHVFGHSMGAMIACKLAAKVPERISSLALLNVTGGGFECLPKIDQRVFSILIRFLKSKTLEERAAVDLDTHYTKGYLDEYVGPNTRRLTLHQEYVSAISSFGMQPKIGLEGQINACWRHSMSQMELEAIRSARIHISFIHGRYDIIAQLCYAKSLAEKLLPCARMIVLPGAHLVSHERAEEVNEALLDLINAAESKMDLHDWCYISDCSGTSEFQAKGSLVLFGGRENMKEALAAVSHAWSKIVLCLLSFVALVFMFILQTYRTFRPNRMHEANL